VDLFSVERNMKQEEIIGSMKNYFTSSKIIQLLSPDPVFGKSSFHVAYHQDWVSGSFVVQAFEAVYV